jgi:hypothetical protein
MQFVSRTVLISTLFGCFGTFFATVVHGTGYIVTEFPTADPSVINDKGELAGTLRRAPDASSTDHPFYWRPNSQNGTTGTLTELPLLAGANGDGSVTAINELGQIVGASHSSTSERAVIWSPTSGGSSTHSVHELLPTADSRTDFLARGINELGAVVINSFDSAGLGGFSVPVASFFWKPNVANGVAGTSRGIPALTNGDASVAMDINDAGQVGGRSFRINGLSTPNFGYIWDSSPSTQTLPVNLGFAEDDWRGVFPLAMNNSGTIVGYAVDRLLGRNYGFRWVPNTPNASTGSVDIFDNWEAAIDVNDAGMVVGNGRQNFAYLWSESQGQVALDSLIEVGPFERVSTALAINNVGQVLARKSLINGSTMAILLTPVPEPHCIFLALLALIALGNIRVDRR